MKTFLEYVNLREMAAGRSASRMLSQATNPRIVTAFITSCRNGVPYYVHNGQDDDKIPERHLKNKKRSGRYIRTSMDDLEQDLRNQGWGLVKTMGGYPEDVEGSEEKRKVNEPSFMISKEDNENPEDTIKSLMDLAKDYNQDGVIIKLPDEKKAHEYRPKDRTSVHYGTPEIKRGAEFHTRLRKGQDVANRKLSYPDAYSQGIQPFDPDNPTIPG